MKKQNYLNELKKAFKAITESELINFSPPFYDGTKNSDNWDFFKQVSGFDKRDETYVSIYFIRDKQTKTAIIELTHNTVNTDLILEILKASGTACVIHYHQVVTTTTEKATFLN